MSLRRLLRAAHVALRSAGVGVVATALDLGVLALLVTGLGIVPRWASLPALLTGVAAQFVGNKWFAFGDRKAAWLGQLGWFAIVELLAVAANMVLYEVVMRPLPAHFYLPARLVTTSAVYFAVSLPLWSLIFRGTPSARKAAS